ncbi:choline kinase [Aequitasia blattaphilus]|uniref:Sugar phosphate nucleotidyltransferase n=1 Tax=Aequitasia blattaphilus TaxID=2949332 RepID=A0ABT1E933_9FIRM|nr:sugar phosphate nucleotidyltransferase [Aequitasia blattaphilus]MCP1101376.1 sugar phosphate nucleotidyltransferase [Aequitasia blattaphilus]MCR8614016.1 sugar phosphate nucleotidyltransferase [Aequitasia blattaphilus]
MTNKITLVIMAAGIGSRFGKGIKQLEGLGPNGEAIMEYSIRDAVAAGFEKVVIVIRKDIQEVFDNSVRKRLGDEVELSYVYQEMDQIPNEYNELIEGRTKPWGTGQAILSCKDEVNGSFLVINADDYYGKEAYEKAYSYLTREESADTEKMQAGMVGFELKNTLSASGGVTRGVCKVDDTDKLIEIRETQNIQYDGTCIKGEYQGEEVEFPEDTVVSMNMFAFTKDFFGVLETGFRKFLEGTLQGTEDKKEFLVPVFIEELLQKNQMEVNVLYSSDRWFGITYQADKEAAKEELAKLYR